MSSHRIAVLAGDGVGPEIMAPTLTILDELGSFDFDERLVGGASVDAHDVSLTDDAFAAAQSSDAVLFGAVGGPKWAGSSHEHEGMGLLRLRIEMGLYANLRPIFPLPSLHDASSLRPEIVGSARMTIVRELTGGLYIGARGRNEDGSAFDTCIYTPGEVDRIARIAFGVARTGVVSVDKANVLETSRLWRETVTHVHEADYPDVPLSHMYVDNAAMQLVAKPGQFDVLVTENVFGDILSDVAAVIVGSLGMVPSASLGDGSGPGLFEPAHGSAPDIAGQGVVNPGAMLLSAAMMLRHAFGMEAEAAAIESALDGAFGDGARTRDLGGTASTQDVTRAVLHGLHVGRPA